MATGMNGNSEMKCCSNECDSKTSENDIEADYEPLFDVEEDEDCGRYLVASENVAQGQVILFEKPTGNFDSFSFYPQNFIDCNFNSDTNDKKL